MINGPWYITNNTAHMSNGTRYISYVTCPMACDIHYASYNMYQGLGLLIGWVSVAYNLMLQ